jgi:inner membrane protein
MRAPNHIAGGIVFTGTFASFWNVNIFSDWVLLLLTIFASLLPDIDHTRSTVGKAFYPVAKWIDKRYGHRTITHSLPFFLVISGFIYLLEFHTSLENIFLTFFFAFLSHLLLDMMTIQGIPLFYPFKRNPCVIPADPGLRIRGGSSQEFIVFGFFVMIMSFSYPLFQNGFWHTYNNQFATIKHLNSSNRKTEKILEVNYIFTNNSNQIQGSGLLVYSDNSKSIIWKENQEIIEISSEAVLEKLEFKESPYPKIYQEFEFSGITIDSLNSVFNDGLVIYADINSSQTFFFGGKESKETNLKYALNPKLKELMKKDYEREQTIELKENEISHKKQLFKLYNSQKNQLLVQKNDVLNSLKFSDISDYKRENLYSSLKEIQKEIEKIKPFENDIPQLENELEIYRKVTTESAKFYGKSRILRLAKTQENIDKYKQEASLYFNFSDYQPSENQEDEAGYF